MRVPSTDEIRDNARIVRLHNALQEAEYLRCVCVAKCHRDWRTGVPRDCKHIRAQREL